MKPRLETSDRSKVNRQEIEKERSIELSGKAY
jgi:hypothetical protein